MLLYTPLPATLTNHTIILFQATVSFAELMSTNEKSDEVKKDEMKVKTMEAFLMIEADTATSLEKENRDPQQFLLLLGNIVRNIARACAD